MSTWIKVYNSLPSHPKIAQVGDRAAWLYVCGLCYCNEHLTDGVLHRSALPMIAPGVRSVERLADALVQVGLWDEAPLGWVVHDYAEHQRSAEEVKRKRASDAARQRARRESHA